MNAGAIIGIVIAVKRALAFICGCIQEKTSDWAWVAILGSLVPMLVRAAALALRRCLVPELRVGAAYTCKVGCKMRMRERAYAVASCRVNY